MFGWCRVLLFSSLVTVVSAARGDDFHVGTYFSTPTVLIYEQLVLESYQRIGIDIQLRRMPVTRGLIELSRGHVDANLFHLSAVGLRLPHLIDIPQALPNLDVVLVTLKSYPFSALPRSEKGYRVGIFLGFPELLTLVPASQTVNVFGNYDQLLALLRHRRIDLAIMSSWDAQPLLLESPDLKVLAAPRYQCQVYHTLNAEHVKLVDDLARAFQEFHKAQRLDAIVSDVVQHTQIKPTRRQLKPTDRLFLPRSRARAIELGS